MDVYLKEVGARIRQAREAKKLSQLHLAEILNVSPSYLSNIETGKQNMSIMVLYNLCNALEVTADWILRNNSPEATAITISEISSLLDDCTPNEREAIVKMIQSMKSALRTIKGKNDDA